MKILLKNKTLLIAAGIIAFAFLFHVYQIFNMFLDFKIIDAIDLNPSLDGSLRKPPLQLVNGLMMPTNFKGNIGKLISTPFPGSYARKLIPISAILEETKKLPLALVQKFADEIVPRVDKGFAELPSAPETPEFLDLAAPIHNFRDCRETARFWYVIARKLAHEGKIIQAMTGMGGILLFGHLLECDSPEGMSLIAKMIGISIRKMGATGLLEIAPELALPKEEVVFWFNRVKKLNDKYPPISLAYKCERLFIPTVLNRNRIEEWSKKNPGKRAPTTLSSAFYQKKFQKEYLGETYDPFIKACDMPFAEGMKVMSAQGKKLESLCSRVSTPGPHWIGYFFQPRRYFMEVMLAICVPNMKKSLEQGI